MIDSKYISTDEFFAIEFHRPFQQRIIPWWAQYDFPLTTAIEFWDGVGDALKKASDAS